MKCAVLLLVAACQSGGGDDYPTGSGGGGPVVSGGGGRGGDAGIGDGGDGDGGVSTTGRVCLITDLRKLTTCSATGAKGLVVSLGTRTVTIASDHDDGTFTIAAPLGTDLTWHVTSSVLDRIVPSAMPFGSDNSIPVVSTQLYRDLLSTNKVEVADQQGSIVVRVVRGVTPAVNVSATSTVPGSVTLYDSNNSLLDWNESSVGATGAAGVVWFPDVSLSVRPPTLATITLTPQGGTPVSTPAVVENQTITFVTKEVP